MSSLERLCLKLTWILELILELAFLDICLVSNIFRSGRFIDRPVLGGVFVSELTSVPPALSIPSFIIAVLFSFWRSVHVLAILLI